MNLRTDLAFMKVDSGWKPGAVSKVLLKKLRNAKLRMSAVDEIKRTKRIKKQVENKHTLKIKKVDGKFEVEMQVASESPDESINQYSPIVFKIENSQKTSKKNKEKLVKAATNSKSDLCKEFCFKSHNDAIGFLSDRNAWDEDSRLHSDIASECSLNEETDCSSSELDFEIDFSPPIAKYKPSQKQT